MQAPPPLLLVYQPGQVGSRTVLRTLASLPGPARAPFRPAVSRHRGSSAPEAAPGGLRAAVSGVLESRYSLFDFAFIGYRGRATLIDPATYLPSADHRDFDQYLDWLVQQEEEIGYQAPGIQIAGARTPRPRSDLADGRFGGRPRGGLATVSLREMLRARVE